MPPTPKPTSGPRPPQDQREEKTGPITEAVPVPKSGPRPPQDQ